jgi:hypothetical protein
MHSVLSKSQLGKRGGFTMKAPSFEIAHGTTCGSDHLGEFGVPGISINQDASYCFQLDNVTIAVVSDGCSDRLESGVGATLLCRFFVAAVEANISMLKKHSLELFAKRVQDEIVTRIQSVCMVSASSGGKKAHSMTQVADDLFLCTLIGVVLTPELTVILAAGDGVWSVNNKPLQKLGPFPRNEPPYLGYLVRGNHLEQSELKVVATYPTQKVSAVWIGSDGCADLPPDFLSKMNSQRATFTNPEFLNRELRKLNSQSVTLSGASEKLKLIVTPTWTERMLPDDTTVILINKVPEPFEQPHRPIGQPLTNTTPVPKHPLPQDTQSEGWTFPALFRGTGSKKGSGEKGVDSYSKGESDDPENS